MSDKDYGFIDWFIAYLEAGGTDSLPCDHTNFRYLDEAPESIRDHSFFRHYPKTREDWVRETEEDLRKLAIRFPQVFRPRDKHERARGDFVSEERRASDYQSEAKAFVAKLLASVPPADRTLIAAPNRDRSPRGRKETTGFDPRHPELQELRHAPFFDLDGRSFTEVAAEAGRTAQYAAVVRAEITLALLVKGQVPPFAGFLDGRGVKHDPEHVGPYAAAIVPELFREHENSLLEAERRGIYRTPVELLSRHAKLLGKAWQALTTLKVGRRDVTTIRAFFRVVGELVEACHQEASAARMSF